MMYSNILLATLEMGVIIFLEAGMQAEEVDVVPLRFHSLMSATKRFEP